MSNVTVGFSAECGWAGVEQDGTLRISLTFPGMTTPVNLDIDVDKGDDALDVAEGIDAAMDAATKGTSPPLTQGQANGVQVSTLVAAGGEQTTQSGKEGEVTQTTLCKVEAAGVDSVDVGTDVAQLQSFVIGGPPPEPPPTTPRRKKKTTKTTGEGSKPTPEDFGVSVVKVNGTTKQPTIVDCEEYRKKLKEKQDAAAKKGESRSRVDHDNTFADWFCDPRRGWQRIHHTQTIRSHYVGFPGVRPLAHMVVGARAPRTIQWGPNGALGLTGVLYVPFVVIGESREEQLFEMQMRLASSGVITQDRSDGVIVPTRFLVGNGRATVDAIVRTFGIITPFDPLGYGMFPWTIVAGDANDVARHAAAVASGDAFRPNRSDRRFDLGKPRVDGTSAPSVVSIPQAELWDRWASTRRSDS